MDTLRKATIIFKSGGGVGYNFSKLRPEGDFVKSSGGRASGPISFMTLFDQMTEVIRQGGIRRGANMGILDINHPDIEKFIVAKRGNVALRNFNISVFIKSDFWDYYRKKKPYPLINPRNKEIVKNVDPVTLFDLIVYQGWESAEPGVVFGENINKYNPLLKSLGPIRTTNPCVVGNTLVAVADGRNYVPIKQLAKEKKDVPVYCYGKGKVQIRIGRNPRKTREKVPVWKVTLDDRSHIIATEDHKFRNRNNNEIKLKDLKPGTILMPFYKFQDEQAKGENPDWKISLNNGKVTTEHSLLMEYYQNKILSSQKLSFEVQVSLYNHKVTSVEFYGYEDVYNITVDDFHTVAYITNHNAKTKFTKKPLLSGIITSQCGELPLYGNESCNLGSINVWAFVREKQSNSRKREVGFDWKDFERTIKITTRFLDNVIDVNHYPLPEIEEMTLNTRKMGLGIMGLGDLLYDLEISYNSSEGLDFMERLMEFLNYHSKITSIELAKERGKFPLYDKSFYPERKLPCRGTEERRLWRTGRLDWQKIKEEIKKYGLRNAHTTTNAPTGSISMIAGCSSGIEPVFSLVYEKRITVGSFYYVNPVFERVMMREGL
ncbi:MAG: ribonucleoside-diphosphate reductase, adenosylcobalamin-dependent, partial [bacterium]